jgi:hypothetical protein
MTNDNNQPKDLHQITQAELINFLSRMTIDQARSFLPEFRNYYQARKRIWTAIRSSKEVDDNTLETQANNAIMFIQSQEWSKTEIENKILDTFSRIKEQEEMMLYEIKEELENFS